MTDDRKKQIIAHIRLKLREKSLWGLYSRCHLLFLGFLRGKSHRALEPRIHASTPHGERLAKRVRYILSEMFASPELKLEREEVFTPEFVAWCSDVEVKPELPRVKKMRRNREVPRVAE